MQHSDKHSEQLLSLKKSHAVFKQWHHIIFISACAQNVLLQHKRKR